MKVKELNIQQKQKDFDNNLSFAEWLDYFSKDQTGEELNDMEKHIDKSNRFLPMNNQYYQPLQGA